MTRTEQRHALFLVSFAEFWELLSYFGTVSILVLYSTKVFLFSDQLSYAIYGIYLALLCGMPILGGYIADKLMGYLPCIYIGAALLIVGNILLVVESRNFLFLGLAATICGTSLYKPTLTNLVGAIYSEDSSKVDGAYTFFYAVLNCGAIAGPIVYGLIAKLMGWNMVFLFGAIGLLISIVVITLNLKILQYIISHNQEKPKRNKVRYLSIFLIYFFILFSFYLHNYFALILIGLLIFVIIMFFRIMSKQTGIGRRHLLGILLLLFFAIFFFSASMQVGSSITLFTERLVNRNLFGWQVPTAFFAALDPFFVVLFAPFFTLLWSMLAKRKKEPSATIKLVYGLLLGALGFVVFWMAAGSSAHDHRFITLFMLILGYVLIGAGEICLSPAVLGAISLFSPKSVSNTMMGGWYFFMALAGYLASYIDNAISKSSKLLTHTQSLDHLTLINSSHIFLFIALMTGMAALVLFCIARFIDKRLLIGR
jgi:proton-dependent oligopeptide transporter, POT family